MGDPLNDSGSGLDVEASGRPDGHPSDMGSGLLPGGDKGPDPVTGGKTGMPFRPGQKSPGEAKGIETGPLVGPPPRRRDSEDGAIRVPHMVHLSDAGGVENVGFWETEASPIPLGPSSGALLYGKARLFQPPEERPPGGVDGRCVPERGLGPGENLFQKIRLLREKLLDGSVPFLLIAVTTGQGQVRYAIRPAKASGMDMVDLQGNVFRPAVGALPSPFFQEIFPDLGSGQCPLLVFDPGNFRVFHPLEIESDQFLGDSRNGSESSEAFDPGSGGLHPVLQRRGQPAFLPSPVVEPGFPVAERRSSPPPEGPALVQFLFDPCPPMTDLGRMEDVEGLFPVLLLLPDHGDPGGFRPGVDLDPDGLGLSPDPVFQPDRKRGETVDHGLLPFQEKACPFLGAGHERLLVFVQDEYGQGVLLRDALTGLVTQSCDCLPSGMLPTSVGFRPVSSVPCGCLQPELPGSGTEEASRSGS